MPSGPRGRSQGHGHGNHRPLAVFPPASSADHVHPAAFRDLWHIQRMELDELDERTNHECYRTAGGSVARSLPRCLVPRGNRVVPPPLARAAISKPPLRDALRWRSSVALFARH